MPNINSMMSLNTTNNFRLLNALFLSDQAFVRFQLVEEVGVSFCPTDGLFWNRAGFISFLSQALLR
jgi:hypothetical protein